MKSIHFIIFNLVLLIGICFSQNLIAQQLKVTPQKISTKVGETFEVSYSIDQAGNGSFNPPNLTDAFAVVSGPNQYSSSQWINGKMTSSMRFSYALKVVKTGNHELAGASFKTRKKIYKAPSVKVQAKKNPNIKQQQNTPKGVITSDELNQENSPDYFFKVEVDTDRVYIGQQMTAYYVIYSRYNLTNYNAQTAASLQGFWAQDISADRITPRDVSIGDKLYTRYVIKKYALFPQKTGQLEIDPMDITAQIKIPSQRRSRGFFSFSNSKQVELTSKAKTVSVFPLPTEGKPDNFNGAVGNFKLNVRPDKRESKVNEGITLSIGIIGSGNLKLVDAIKLDLDPEEWDVYEPTMEENIYEKNNVIMGSKSYDYLLVPLKEGSLTIPAIKYSYYNPSTEQYETKDAWPLTIKVAASDAILKPQAKKEDKDILDIKTEQASFSSKGNSTLPYLLLGGLYILPFIILPIVVSQKKKTDLEDADVIGRKRKQASDLAKKRLETAKGYMNASKKKEFYNEVIQTIWNYLEDRVNIPASELSKSNIASVLQKQNVQDKTITKLIDLIKYCEMAVFAPVADADKLDKTYNGAIDTIADIEEELA